MARRADHTREELTELAIAAGLKIIKDEGIASFSARRVAYAIGYTVGTLYNVFGTYDELMLHINARTLDEWFAVMEKALKKAKSKDGLHVLARTYIEFSRANYRQWSALFEYHLSDNRNPPEWYIPKMTRFFALVEQLLLPVLAGDRRRAKRAARVLWAGIHGICILSLSGKLDLIKADSPEVLAISFVDNYMTGLACEK